MLLTCGKAWLSVASVGQIDASGVEGHPRFVPWCYDRRTIERRASKRYFSSYDMLLSTWSPDRRRYGPSYQLGE